MKKLNEDKLHELLKSRFNIKFVDDDHTISCWSIDELLDMPKESLEECLARTRKEIWRCIYDAIEEKGDRNE